MSRDWTNKWSNSSWDWQQDDWNSQTNSWSVAEVQPPSVRIPPDWQTTTTMFDDQVVFGHRFYKTVQPSAWSRRKGFVGLNPLTIPIGLLTRHGANEYGLRLLSEGRFMGVITTRTIAESVFGSQILRSFRESSIDIDSLCEHLHRTIAPEVPVPSKSEDPVAFMAPLISALTAKAKDLSPAKHETAALKELQAVQKRLKETEAKLRLSQQSASTHPTPPSSLPTVPGSEEVDVFDPIENSPEETEKEEEVKPPPPPPPPPKAPGTKKRPPSSAALGASPKAKQRSLGPWLQREKPTEKTPEAPPSQPLTAQEVMNPSAPSMRDNQPSGSSAGEIKKWMESFDVETQQTAKKILQMLGEQKYSKEKLQNAAAQYGLNVKESLKMTPKSLQQVIAVAAALSS